VKKMIFAAALVAALIPFAVAQDNNRLPQASLDREVDVRVPAVPGTPAVLGNPRHVAPAPPTYCKPCLFYAGDFDSNASDANGLANEVDVIVSSGAAVYAPFIVKGTWKVSGLFTDNFASLSTLDPATSPYEVRKGIPAAGGSGGKLVCHGKSKSTNTDTGLNDFGYEVYATKVHVAKCTLKAGKYWESVVPYCTGSECGSYRAFEANDDGAMNHKFGTAEPANNSFFNSVYFGATFQPSSQQQSSSRFSDGVIGTK
jgi:hypothetical protein